MSFVSGSFSAGQVPTVALWNQMWSNMDSLHDGSGILTNAITGSLLASNAILLGYNQIVGNFVLSSAQSTATQVPGLTATVTVPAGGRSVEITGFCGAITLAAGVAVLTIWDGVVNSGTQIGQFNVITSTTGAVVQAIVTPAAGSKAYNIGIANSGLNNTTVGAGATQPAFISVKLI